LHQRGRLGKRGHTGFDAGVEGRDVRIQRVDDGELLEQEGVVGRHAAHHRLPELGPLLLHEPLGQRGELVRIGAAGDQGLEDCATGLAHDVRDHAPEFDVRRWRSWLHPFGRAPQVRPVTGGRR
jgi:hypothetical protein